jgi:hypothetical protein
VFRGLSSRRNRQQKSGYEILHAQEVLENLLEGGFKLDDLPRTEALCREIRRLPLDIQGKVWKLVTKHAAAAGRDPIARDIDDIGGKLMDDDDDGDGRDDETGAPSKEDTKILEQQLREEQQAKVLSDVKIINRKLTFSLTKETLTDDFRRRLTVELMAIGARTTELLKVVKFDEKQKQVAVPDGEPFEQGDHEQFEAARNIIEEKQEDALKQVHQDDALQG